MIGLIAAVSSNGVIGKNNSLPFNYKEDMQFFRKTTSNKDFPPTVIMGRRTFESMGGKKLAGRRNIVITSKEIEGIETHSTISAAMDSLGDTTADIWFIGGENVYREAMKYAEVIYLTLIPEEITGSDLAYFPWIDPSKFLINKYIPLFNAEGTQTLQVVQYYEKQYISDHYEF